MINQIVTIANQDIHFNVIPTNIIQGKNLIITIDNLSDSSIAWSWLSTTEPTLGQTWNTSTIIQSDSGTGSVTSVTVLDSNTLRVLVPLPLITTAYNEGKTASFIFIQGGDLIQILFTINDRDESGGGALLSNNLTLSGDPVSPTNLVADKKSIESLANAALNTYINTDYPSLLASQEQIRAFSANASSTNSYTVPFSDHGALANEKYLERKNGFNSTIDLEARGASSADATDVLINSGEELSGVTLAFGGTSANATTMVTNNLLGKSVKFTSSNSQRVTTTENWSTTNFSGCGWFVADSESGNPSLVAGNNIGTPNVYLNSSLGVTLEKSNESGGFADVKAYALNQPMFFAFSYNNSTNTAVIVQNDKDKTASYTKTFSAGVVDFGSRFRNSRFFDGKLKAKVLATSSTSASTFKQIYRDTYSLYFPSMRIAKPLLTRFNGTKKVFIILGQSNADGRALVSGLDTWGIDSNLAIPEAEIFNPATGNFEALKFGTGANNNPSNASGTNDTTQFGCELNLANHLCEKYGKVSFIKLGVGGTSLYNYWLPSLSGQGYDTFKNSFLDPAIAKLAGTNYEIAGFIWIQGESDASDGRSTAQYQADLGLLINQVRTDTGEASLPFYVAKLAYQNSDTSLAAYTNIRTAQDNYVAGDANAYSIETTQFQKQDDLHYNALGQLTLGEKIANSIINFINI